MPSFDLARSGRFRLAEARAFEGGNQISVIGVWRAPEELGMSLGWRASRAALIDVSVFGRRLIGNAANRKMMPAALSAVGVNPLVVAAFRDRSERGTESLAGTERTG